MSAVHLGAVAQAAKLVRKRIHAVRENVGKPPKQIDLHFRCGSSVTALSVRGADELLGRPEASAAANEAYGKEPTQFRHDLPLRDWCKKLYKPAALLKNVVLSRPSA
jgi:hypothetical protein